MPFDPAELSRALKELLRILPEGKPEAPSLAFKRINELRAEINSAIKRLTQLSIELDAVKYPAEVFDPTDPRRVGSLIAKTMLEQASVSMSSLQKFYGSGVYAIFYRGSFPAYAPIAGTQTPIYVGSAEPANRRATTPKEQETRLWRRLGDHTKNIKLAKNLDLADFDCRYLVVATGWEGAAERYLIERFKPIWNDEVKICFGFGKHGDRSTTRANKRSPWDTLHPGRPWAADSPSYRLTDAEIIKQIAAHYAANPPER